jgi:hypothetical protein
VDVLVGAVALFEAGWQISGSIMLGQVGVGAGGGWLLVRSEWVERKREREIDRYMCVWIRGRRREKRDGYIEKSMEL